MVLLTCRDADGDGGGRDEKYEINSIGEPARTGSKGKTCSVMPKPNTEIILSWICAPCGGCG